MKILKPLGDWIIAEDIGELEAATSGGIIVKQNANTSLRMAKVTHIGEGRRTAAGTTLETRVKVGEVVWYNKDMAEGILVNGVPTVVFQEAAVTAVVEP
jgi:co-chaperonin GroES (HSP10)